jgi:hypothetical protein
MKYLSPVIYLVIGIILPLVYISTVDKVNSREIFLLVIIFITCAGTGIWFIFRNRAIDRLAVSNTSNQRSGNRIFPDHAGSSPIRSVSERIKDHSSMGRVASIEEPKTASPVRVIEKRTVTNPPQAPRPEIPVLMEDIKNLIKLESWLMALQKANELIHYYPDAPEADKIRGNINVLVKKVQESRQR